VLTRLSLSVDGVWRALQLMLLLLLLLQRLLQD